MRRHVEVRNWTKVVAFIAVGAIIVAACGSSKKSATTAAPVGTASQSTTAPSGTKAPAGTTAPAGTKAPSGGAHELVIDRDMDLTTLDLSLDYCDTCQIFNTAVYETLITVDPADPNKLLPRLATSWEANADNTVFTFKLNPAAKFDDGSAVESKDVKFSWERLANMKGSASYLMAGLKSIDTPDAGTVVVTFSAANSAFLPIVAASYLGIINSDVATAQGATSAADAATTDKAGNWFLAHSAGSGPYKLESYTQGDKLVLARNDSYWGPKKPVFPKVTLAEVKDSSSQLQQLQSGDADISMQISVDSVGQLQGNADVTTKIVDSYNYVYIALSPGAAGGEKLQDITVRKAIKEAIDYDGAIQALVGGKGKKQASPIPNGFIGSAGLPLPEYNLDDAKKLLSAAGLADGFDLDATYPSANVYGVDFNLMMQKIQQDLAKVKVNLKLTPIQFPDWVTRINAKGIPLTAVYFAPDHTDTRPVHPVLRLDPQRLLGYQRGWRGGGQANGQPEGIRAVDAGPGLVG